ncbi:hypothetical protein ES703_116825 [subsurface metagenome]
MAVGCKLFGDWDKITQLGSRMQTAVLQAGERLLESIGEDLEGTVRGHMQSQDLGWPPLKPKTLAAKLKHGLSEKILIRTSHYFQAITHEVTPPFRVDVGVKRGEDADIAAIHEFGAPRAGIPPRPLWKTSVAEVEARLPEYASEFWRDVKAQL